MKFLLFGHLIANLFSQVTCNFDSFGVFFDDHIFHPLLNQYL